jgi:penicillin-binding protein 1C
MAKRSCKKRKVFLFWWLIALILGSGAFAYSIVSALPDPERISERSVVESTKIYDRTGKVLLYEIHGEERRTVIALGEIPKTMKEATIAAEDDKFYKHIGLDGLGILRALLKNVARGGFYQGGSTITQQLIKSSLLTTERTLSRKIKEAILAVLVERKYSKDEILELYLNQIPYGANAYGVESAAQTYFAKRARDLTLSESALLASLPKAPTYYFNRQNELLKRKDWVLDRMAELGFVQRDEAEVAKKERLVFSSIKQNIRAPHFVFFVREYLNEKYGEEFVENGGLKVTTTLDWELQEKAEKIIKEGAEQNEKLVKAYNASLVSIRPQTGEILAMVGSRDYWANPLPEGCHPGVNCKFDPKVNVAVRPRQPGSAFKPFVYATAFKKGYLPETVLFDAPTEFNVNCSPNGTPGKGMKPEDCYHPQNYDEKFRGPVTLRKAHAQSLNLPSVKLLYLAGIADSIRTAQDLGISTLDNPDRFGLTLVLGGAEVKLLEMTSAFGVFSQEGILHPYAPVLRVEGPQGTVLEEKKEISIPSLDTQTARTINDVLSDNDARVPVFSPRSSLYFAGRQVAAKTGTTQDFRDAWIIGYTPSIVTGVWVGNSDNSAMNQNVGSSIMVAGPLWHKFMEAAFSQTPPEFFSPPERVFVEKPALRGIYQGGPYVRIDRISKKLAAEYTPPELVAELGLGKIQTILAYVQKENPWREAPENPFADPQSSNWQAGIEVWLGSNAFSREKAPTEYDDLHLPSKRPQLKLLNLPNSVSSLTQIQVEARATFPLREVSLFIDDALVGSKIAPIIAPNLSFPLTESAAPGPHIVKITAYDAVGNKETVSQEVVVTGINNQ